MTKPELIEKIEAFCTAHQVEIDKGMYRLSEPELTLLWVKLQMGEK